MELEAVGRKYNKVGYSARATLLNLITIEGKSIKQVAPKGT